MQKILALERRTEQSTKKFFCQNKNRARACQFLCSFIPALAISSGKSPTKFDFFFAKIAKKSFGRTLLNNDAKFIKWNKLK